MKWVKAIFTFISGILMYMIGGQGKIGNVKTGKATRRFGIPTFAVIMAWASGKFKWKYLAFLLLIPILVMGYGEKSILMKLLNNEILVQLAYGILLSLPFLFFGLIRWLIAMVSLVIAFATRAGSLGQLFGMDILIEDIVRGGVLLINIVINIFL